MLRILSLLAFCSATFHKNLQEKFRDILEFVKGGMSQLFPIKVFYFLDVSGKFLPLIVLTVITEQKSKILWLM